MELQKKFESELYSAIRNNDVVRKLTIRMILSNIKLFQVEKGRTPDDQETLDLLQKELKIRQEAIDGAMMGNRQDLIDQNQSEIAVIMEFLPKQLDMKEIELIAKQTMEEIGASELNDMGNVMKALLPKMKGKAPNSLVSQVVRELLSKG